MLHPKREQYRQYFLDNIPNIKITEDRGKGLWDTARRAWLSYDKNKEFHCVIQDDTILCNDFLSKVDKMIKENGDKYVYCLFIRDRRGKDQRQKNLDFEKGLEKGYLTWWKVGWALGIIVPTKLIDEMIEYCDKMTHPSYFNKDDVRINEFCKSIKKRVYYPLPCLVQHRPTENSLIGLGHNKGRQAVKFKL